MRVLIWFLLVGLSLAIVVMASGHGQGTIGDLSANDFGSLLVNVAWLVLIGGVVIALFRERVTKAITAAVLWIVVALVLMVGYTYRFQLRDMTDQVMAELVPGHAGESGRRPFCGSLGTL
jgi:aspartyl protease family protein